MLLSVHWECVCVKGEAIVHSPFDLICDMIKELLKMRDCLGLSLAYANKTQFLSITDGASVSGEL